MGSMKLPTDTAGWEHMARGMVKAELALAGMNHIDLQAALRRLGIEQNTSNISAKLSKGRFSAIFMLQVLVAIGVEDIRLPRADQSPRP